MRFQAPYMLLLLLLLLPWALLVVRREQARPGLPVFWAGEFQPPVTFPVRCARLLPWLRLPALILIILALARPQAIERETTITSQGVDLVIALDLSTSMLAQDRDARDTAANRLAMAKAVLSGFVASRHNDRLGLVAFAARPYAAVPLTRDHAWLLGTLARLEAGTIEDGSAIGDAILAALNRLAKQPAASRAVILITDGRSNAGATDPRQAAAAARALGVRVHTVGIGSRGYAVIPVADPLGGTIYHKVQADLDEALLRVIALTTGGSYARCDDQQALQQVFNQIDRLEKRPLQEKIFFTRRELYPPLLLGALMLMLTEAVLGLTWLRRLL